MNKNRKFRQGGVSMFLVVIASSLIALIVASFMRLAVRDQSQASNQDLSQSAYDSAQAGVEDAKRYMTKYAADCASGYDLSTVDCQRMKASMESNSCNMLYGGGSGVTSVENGETVIQTHTGDRILDQAYTCVKISQNTPDFIGKISVGQPKIVPLRGVSTFRRIRLSWHTREDMTNVNREISLDSVLIGGRPTLLSNSDYSRHINRPAVIKSQFYGYTNGMSDLSEFDTNFSDDGRGLNEQLYYPVSGSGAIDVSLPVGERRTGSPATRTADLSLVRCERNLDRAVYACSVTVDLGHNVERDHTAFMRLTPIYKSANFKVELLNGDDVVNFDGVQPKIDSTGRANDQLRRVESRIEFVDQNMPVPDFALQLDDGGSPLCKDFWVTNINNNIDESCK